MTSSFPLMLFAGAALLSATPGVAATPIKAPAAQKTTATHVVATRRTTTITPAGKGRMVIARLANGKTVTYNCSLPGNAAKKACK